MKEVIKSLLQLLNLFEMIIKIRNTLKLRLLLRSDRLLKLFIKNDIRGLEQLSTEKQENKVRILTVWEGDGKYIWLERANVFDEFEICHLDRHTINIIFQYFLRDYFRERGRNPYTELYKEKHAEAREAYLAVCQKIATILKELVKLDLVILPKLHDDWIIDFIKGLQTKGIVILANERESVTTPKRMETGPYYFKEFVKLEVDALCLANQSHYDFWRKAGHPESKMKLIGDIKSDYWSSKHEWLDLKAIHKDLQSDRTRILFFAFGRHTYINYYYGEKDIHWDSLNADVHDSLIRLLIKHRGKIQLIYKTGGKPHRDLFKGFVEFEKTIKEKFDVADFIYLDAKYSTLDLINTSDIVLGFQTTGLIEGLFTSKPVISVGWGELFDEIKDDLLPLYKNPAFLFAHSQEQLESQLDHLILAPTTFQLTAEQKQSRKEFRDTYYYKSDGKRSQALLHIAKELIASKS